MTDCKSGSNLLPKLPTPLMDCVGMNVIAKININKINKKIKPCFLEKISEANIGHFLQQWEGSGGKNILGKNSETKIIFIEMALN